MKQRRSGLRHISLGFLKRVRQPRSGQARGPVWGLLGRPRCPEAQAKAEIGPQSGLYRRGRSHATLSVWGNGSPRKKLGAVKAAKPRQWARAPPVAPMPRSFGRQIQTPCRGWVRAGPESFFEAGRPATTASLPPAHWRTMRSPPLFRGMLGHPCRGPKTGAHGPSAIAEPKRRNENSRQPR